MEMQHDNIGQEESNEFLMYDEGMIEPEYESSDNEPHLAYVDVENGDGGNVLIGLKETRVRFKVCILRLSLSVPYYASKLQILDFNLNSPSNTQPLS